MSEAKNSHVSPLTFHLLPLGGRVDAVNFRHLVQERFEIFRVETFSSAVSRLYRIRVRHIESGFREDGLYLFKPHLAEFGFTGKNAGFDERVLIFRWLKNAESKRHTFVERGLHTRAGFLTAVTELFYPGVGVHNVIADLPAELPRQLSERFESGVHQHLHAYGFSVIEKEVAHQAKIVFADGIFDELTAFV